jgi:plastocyanin
MGRPISAFLDFMTLTRFCLLLCWLLFAACLPQVGPLIDAGAGGALATGGGGGGTASGGGAAAGGGSGVGGGTAAGGGTADPGCPGFANCITFVDMTGTSAPVITFPNGSDTYAPKCIRVTAGTTITFSGSFGSHPLEQECGPASGLLTATTGNSAAFRLDAPGTYGYYCLQHGSPSGSGMAGAIEVVR